MEKLIDLNTYPVKNVLPILLQDKTTKQNIIFATDSYIENGPEFSPQSPMTAIKLIGLDPLTIQPRILKAKEQQTDRTRKRAEVFTPSWLCAVMNNYADEVWFGRKDVFTVVNQSDHTWTVHTGKIEFPEKKTWKQYVESRRLEITCGEAPYLASRYDASTGEIIFPPDNRIGILDRKLRIVKENTDTEEEWLKWAFRAYQSSYGYEFQGDSLLIARINLLMSFVDYMQDALQRNPTEIELKKFANVIAWNILQMDGLTDVPPYQAIEENHQLSLFEDFDTDNVHDSAQSKEFCKIYDWRRDNSIIFNEIKETGNKMSKGLFDFIIGNPPYQEFDGGAGVSATPVYNKVIKAAQSLNPEAMSFIIPAKWYSGGKGLDNFRDDMLNDERISLLEDYTNSLDVFPNVDVAGGVCEFVWRKGHSGKCHYINHFNGNTTDVDRYLNEFPTFIRYPIAVEVINKVKAKCEPVMSDMVSRQKPFGLRTYVKPDTEGDINIKYSGGVGPFKRENVPSGREMIDQWKVIISYLTAEHAGQPDKNGMFRVLSTMQVLPPKVICTETYLVAGSFNTEEEARSLEQYLKTKFVRFLVAQIAMTQHLSKQTFSFVPQQNFLEQWTDNKLFRKYGLNNAEVTFINGMIKEMT